MRRRPDVSSARSVPTLPGATATLVNGAVTLAIDAASPLSGVGSAALVQSPLGTLLVVRTAQGAFSVVTALCTHEACTITGLDGSTFVCPCHGSEFNTSGQVLSGPAGTSLRQFGSSSTKPRSKPYAAYG